MSETSERIAKTIDEHMLGASTLGSRFAARQLARAIEADLSLAGFVIAKRTATQKGDDDGR